MCVGVWVCGCVGAWVCGCVGVWVCGCIDVVVFAMFPAGVGYAVFAIFVEVQRVQFFRVCMCGAGRC